MKPSADNLILCMIVALAVAAVAVVSTGSLVGARRRSAERDFQRAVGGLGLGCQLDLSRSSWQFDPRVADDNPLLDMVPGVGELSPWHAIALFPSSSPAAARPALPDGIKKVAPALRDGSDSRSPEGRQQVLRHGVSELLYSLRHGVSELL
jgi:hypothetical protein